MKPALSVAIIARDEAAVIGRCLESIKDLADEIIVVDTGSKDNTVAIAKKYTNKVYHFEWINDFSAARNYSFSFCTKDWILWLDADDVVRPEDVEKIRQIDYSDKEIIICNYEYCHDEFDQSMCTIPRERIVKRSLGIKWEEPIHEYLPIHHKTFKTDVSIHHYKKDGSSERNLKILEAIVIGEENVSSRSVYYLGCEYQDAGRIDEAIPQLQRFIDIGDGFWEDIYKAWQRLAQCYRYKKDDANFKRCIFESIKIEERRAEPYYILGEWHMDKQDWHKAIHWLELCTMVKRPSDLLASFQPEYYSWLPCLQLCICYNNVGNVQKSYEWNKKCLEYRPHDSRAINNDLILTRALKRDGILPQDEPPKPKKPKIGWIAPVSPDAAQIRIRVLRVHQWLLDHGYHSEIVDYADIISKDLDIAVVGKGFDENHYKNILLLKSKGKKVYADVCESLFEFPWFKEILEVCDKVICCSHELERRVKEVNPNTVVIEDAWEYEI